MRERLTSKRQLLLRSGAALLVLLAIAFAGYSYSVASGKPSDGDLAREYRRGFSSGQADAKATGRTQAHQAHENGYWEGWEEGYEEGEEEGQREGAKLATPERLDFQTRYMVTYEPGPNGPLLRGYLEMPLNTLWECEDLDSCFEIAE